MHHQPDHRIRREIRHIGSGAGMIVLSPELRRDEKPLRENSELLRVLFESCPDAVLLLDVETGIILDCNEAACRMNGYERHELVGQSISMLNVEDGDNSHLDDQLQGMDYIAYLYQYRQLKFETLHRHKDGTIFPIEVATNLITVDGRDILLGIDRDISDRKAAELALRASEARYRLLAQYATDIISRHAADGSVLYASPSLTTIMGYTLDDLKGIHPGSLIHPDDFVEFQRQIRANREIYISAYRMRRKDGRYIWLETSWRYKYHAETGAIQEVICVSRDISDRKRAEAAAQEKSALVEALQDAATAIKSSLRMNEVLDRILVQAARVVPHDTSSITLIDGDEACVVRCRGFGSSEEAYVLSQRFSMKGSSKHRQLIEKRAPIVIEDVRQYEGWTQTPGTSWIRGHVAAPIVVRDQVIGFLHLDSAVVAAFTPEQAHHLQTFADQVALAIYTAQMVDEIQATYHATSFLFAPFSSDNLPDLGYQIANILRQHYDTAECSVLLLEGDSGRITRIAHAGGEMVVPFPPLTFDGPGLIPAAMRARQLLYAPDVMQDQYYVAGIRATRSELVIPLQARDGIIGALDLQSPSPNGFTPNDERILRVFAERAAIAIENLRYAEELERRVASRAADAFRVKEELEAILRSSSDALIVTNTDGTMRQINPAFGSLFGCPGDDWRGKSFVDFALQDGDLLKKALNAAISHNTPQRIELVLRRRDTTNFDADVAISAIREGHTVIGLVCSVRDITDRKRMEIELRRALELEREFGELKTRFVATTSHEFRTPLAVIMTASELLLTYNDRMTAEQKTEKLMRIQEQVKHMAHLLDDVLTVNKTVGGNMLDFDPLPVDIVAFCSDLVNEMETSLAEARFSFAADGAYIWGNFDPHLLRDILTNLLANAVKYSPSAQKIDVRLWCDEAQTRIQIQDYGIGISDDDQKRLFDAFHRGRNVGNVPGTGLGLTIVKHAVEAHGGTIQVWSKVGVGTTFSVMLPNVLVEGKIYDS